MPLLGCCHRSGGRCEAPEPRTPRQSLLLVVGGIARRPAVIGERVEPRDILNLIVAFGHDVVDGVPLTPIANRER